MNITEFSHRTGLSAHTLRYYEKIGLLSNIARSNAGHRDYRGADIEWAQFINRLKETGMPIKEILHYSHLREEGDATMAQRLTLLTEHRVRLEQRIRAERQHLKALTGKIHWYEEQM